MAVAKKKEQRRKKVITVLNKARAMELHAIYQYMNQHYNLDDMDYGDLAAKLKLIAIDEMRHAETFAERIKELGGEPVSEHGKKVRKARRSNGYFHLMPSRRMTPSMSTISFCSSAGKMATASA